jgi:hypothetical protein
MKLKALNEATRLDEQAEASQELKAVKSLGTAIETRNHISHTIQRLQYK